MLRSLLVAGDRGTASQIERLLSESSEIQCQRRLDLPLCTEEIARVVALCAPDVVLVAVESLPSAASFLGDLRQIAPSLPAIAVVKHAHQRLHMALTEAGFSSAVALPSGPFSAPEFAPAVLKSVLPHLENDYGENRRGNHRKEALCSFLPAKGGSGTSLLAANLSCALARQGDLRVLLAELDLASPSIGHLLPLRNLMGIRDAIDCMPFPSDRAWEHFISRVGDLDVVRAGQLHTRRALTTARLDMLLEYACSRYSPVCLDLSANLETYALRALSRSRSVFLVTSADPMALHLAREKRLLLASMGMADRTALLVTIRPGDPKPSPTHLEDFVGSPVCGVFDLGDSAVQKAIRAGQPIPAGSGCGRTLQKLAGWIGHHFLPFSPSSLPAEAELAVARC